MTTKDPNARIDPVLLPFMQEQNEALSMLFLSSLIDERAERVIDRTIKATLPEMRKRDGFSSEDLKAEIVLKLVKRLQQLRSCPVDGVLIDFANYVAVTAYNSCCSYMRSRYPERLRLKNRIRHTLKHQEGLAIWEDRLGAWLCGFSSWRQQNRRQFPSEKASALAQDTQLLELTGSSSRSARRLDLNALLIAIFQIAVAPLELGDLVGLAAELWGIEDHPTIGVGSFHDCALLDITGRSPVPVDLVEARMGLAHLWKEICELPPNQRIVLVLSMRDERGLDGLSLLGNAGVASLREISFVLGIPVLDLSGMWDDLPMDDSKIGLLIGVTRQQVSNLRKSARKRLANRSRAYR
jgi:hypothetical protein